MRGRDPVIVTMCIYVTASSHMGDAGEGEAEINLGGVVAFSGMQHTHVQ